MGKGHNLERLLELLAEAALEAPEWLPDAAKLTPFAAILRYIELDLDAPVDRNAYSELAERTLAWARGCVEEA